MMGFMKLWLKILLCILVVNILGGAGAFFTMGSLREWYDSLAKPPGVPPNSIFGPVWTVLYAMMGTAFALVWHRASSGSAKRTALWTFLAQFLLNLAWTPLFFGAHLLGVALVVIVALWIMILLTILKFRPLDRLAAGLLVPYLIWVSYATYLNAGIFFLNRAG
jgi:tryptophan-rich sensory protein